MKTLIGALCFFILVNARPLRQKPHAPLMLDGVHFYVSDRVAAESYFVDRFAAKLLSHPGRPLPHITLLSLRPGEGTINISQTEPFRGISPEDDSQSRAPIARPSEDSPPRYGVHWLGIRTSSLHRTLTGLEIEGARVMHRNLTIPHDILARAVMIEGPDFNRIALVERKDGRQAEAEKDRAAWGDFGLDHLLILVKSVKENEKFFKEVFGGKAIVKRTNVIALRVADFTIVLTEPEAIGLKREAVVSRDPVKYRPGIDHLDFLYADVNAAAEAIRSRGYAILREPARLKYFNEPTAYTIGSLQSPDGLLCRIVQEDGRRGPREPGDHAK